MFTRNNQHLLFLVFSAVISCFIVCINGTYFGWVDDGFMASLMRGIALPQPVYNPHIMTGFAQVIIGLNKLGTSIAWYGWFIYAMLFFAYVLLAQIFYRLVQKQAAGSILKLALCAMAFSLLMQEFIQRNNFTILACLLTGSGVLFLMSKRQTFLNVVVACAALLSGLLIRFEISVIVLLFAWFASMLATTANGQKVTRVVVMVSAVACVLLLFGIRYISYNEDAVDFNGLSFYEQLIQDAYIYPPTANEKEAIQLEAARGFNQFDAHILTEDVIKRMYSGYQLSWPALLQLVAQKLNMLYQFGNRYPAQSNCFNWWAKCVLLLLMALGYGCMAVVLGKKKNTRIVLLVMILSCVFIILIVALAAKMEDRLLYPLLLLLNLFVLITLHLDKTGKTMPLPLLLFPIFLFGSYRFIEGRKVKSILEADMAAKRAFVSELNSFTGKIFLFDMYTYYMLHAGPFENIELNSKNEYTAGFHYLVRHFHSTQNYFPQQCGTDRVDEIMKCLYSKKERVIFAYWEYNIDFLQRWNKVIYNQSISLEPIPGKNRLSQPGNAYIWDKMNCNYYTFK